METTPTVQFELLQKQLLKKIQYEIEQELKVRLMEIAREIVEKAAVAYSLNLAHSIDMMRMTDRLVITIKSEGAKDEA